MTQLCRNPRRLLGFAYVLLAVLTLCGCSGSWPEPILWVRCTKKLSFKVPGWSQDTTVSEPNKIVVIGIREMPPEALREGGLVKEDACKLIVDGEPHSITGLSKTSKDEDKPRYVLYASCPKDKREMALAIPGREAIHFTAPEKIEDAIDLDEE